jgi:hypothetical protein
MEFENKKVWLNLKQKFFDEVELDGKEISIHWKAFIDGLDIGINCLTWVFDKYTIIDEKKWTVAKIKYGI